MYDGGKFAGGLALFLGLFLSPVWSQAFWPSPPRPEPKITTTATECVASRATMREKHMQILDQWRDASVRRGVHTARLADGQTVAIDLTGTCMKCHPNRKEFCDCCHDYLAVSPYCWDCHNQPEERP
jgi:hypothetical protein